MREYRPRWYGHEKRKKTDEIVKEIRTIEVEGSRGRSGRKKKWVNVIRGGTRECGIDGEMKW